MPDGFAGDTYRLLTSPGPAAIACVELRGAGLSRFIEKHVRWNSDAPANLQVGLVRRAMLLDEVGRRLDDVLLTVHPGQPGPAARIHLHGSPYLVERTTRLLRDLGFADRRVAEAPVFEHARDAGDAMLCALLPTMQTQRGVEWLLERLARLPVDHSARDSFEQMLTWFQTPLRIAIVGPPNAGKSTLVNALGRAPVSIVSDQAGTTRDWVEAPSELDGYPVIWIDTAGLRDSANAIEAEGIGLTRRLAAAADATVLVLDATAARAEIEAFLAGHDFLNPALVVWNKCDADGVVAPRSPAGVAVSALKRTGLAELKRGLLIALGRDVSDGNPSAAGT